MVLKMGPGSAADRLAAATPVGIKKPIAGHMHVVRPICRRWCKRQGDRGSLILGMSLYPLDVYTDWRYLQVVKEGSDSWISLYQPLDAVPGLLERCGCNNLKNGLIPCLMKI
jgi:hypothetical protein